MGSREGEASRGPPLPPPCIVSRLKPVKDENPDENLGAGEIKKNGTTAGVVPFRWPGLGLGDRAAGADLNARATVGAFGGVNDVEAIAFRNRAGRAFSFASAAGDAIGFADLVGHEYTPSINCGKHFPRR